MNRRVMAARIRKYPAEQPDRPLRTGIEVVNAIQAVTGPAANRPYCRAFSRLGLSCEPLRIPSRVWPGWLPCSDFSCQPSVLSRQVAVRFQSC